MRPTGTSAVLKARVIAGSYVVVLAWDVVSGQVADLAGCLGFAIERTEFDQAGAVVESYWMRSIKRFQDKDQGLPPPRVAVREPPHKPQPTDARMAPRPFVVPSRQSVPEETGGGSRCFSMPRTASTDTVTGL